MDLFRAIILGLLQGATEFIPVSSSGHLVLFPWLVGWESPGLGFDTAVHWGTLVAVVVFFWRDWWMLIQSWLRGLLRWDWSDPHARLMWCLILGTIPAAVLGYALEDWFEDLFGKPVWASVFLLVTAGLLVLSERLGRGGRPLDSLRWTDALAIGIGQAIAIAPGISRSGATISAGLLRGLNRAEGARFSFLLSTPIILGAGALQLFGLTSDPSAEAQLPALLTGFLAALLSGYLCIGFLLRYLQRGRLYPFAFYCAWVGISCLLVALLR